MDVSSACILQEFPEDYLTAVRLEAELIADLTIGFIDRSGLVPADRNPGETFEFPRPFLLEIGAVLRIRQWELAGLTEYIGNELPTAAEAYNELIRKMREEPEALIRESEAPPLLLQVLRIVHLRMAWSGRAQLDADIALHDAEQDPLLERLADFLWANRHTGRLAR